MAGFNVNEFRSKIGELGVLKSSSVAVEIFYDTNFGLRGFGADFANVTNNIRFLAEAINIPGVSLSTTEIRRYGYGVIEKKPYVPIFTDIDITFRSDAKGELYTFFQTWMKMIINYDGRGSINSVTGVLPNQAMYEVAYKENYTCSVVIHVLDKQGREPLTLVLTEAFPIFLGPIPMAWQSVNDYVKIPMKFSFKDWYIENRVFVDRENLINTDRPPQTNGPPVNN